MIFLTVGSHEPFDRLVIAVDQWCKENTEYEVFGQITGNGAYRPQNFRHVANLETGEFDAMMKRATFLISHAGMGTIISALNLSKPVVVMPRKGALKETRNDHQIATVARLKDRPGILVADEVTDLPHAIQSAMKLLLAPAQEGLTPYAQPRLISFLEKVLNG